MYRHEVRFTMDPNNPWKDMYMCSACKWDWSCPGAQEFNKKEGKSKFIYTRMGTVEVCPNFAEETEDEDEY